VILISLPYRHSAVWLSTSTDEICVLLVIIFLDLLSLFVHTAILLHLCSLYNVTPKINVSRWSYSEQTYHASDTPTV